MKAGINGIINLSVLDGWWGEGYCGDNGWAIKPTEDTVEPERRDREEARTLYEILQDQVVPLYYRRDSGGTSPQWIRMAKRSIATILPRFNQDRMRARHRGVESKSQEGMGRRSHAADRSTSTTVDVRLEDRDRGRAGIERSVARRCHRRATAVAKRIRRRSRRAAASFVYPAPEAGR